MGSSAISFTHFAAFRLQFVFFLLIYDTHSTNYDFYAKSIILNFEFPVQITKLLLLFLYWSLQIIINIIIFIILIVIVISINLVIKMMYLFNFSKKLNWKNKLIYVINNNYLKMSISWSCAELILRLSIIIMHWYLGTLWWCTLKSVALGIECLGAWIWHWYLNLVPTHRSTTWFWTTWTAICTIVNTTPAAMYSQGQSLLVKSGE